MPTFEHDSSVKTCVGLEDSADGRFVGGVTPNDGCG